MKKRVYELILFLCVSLMLLTCSDKPETVEPIISSIQGKVTDKTDSSPITGASVTTSPTSSSQTTDGSGNYSMDDIGPGDYTITAVKDGYEASTVTVVLEEGKSVTADIQLSPLAPELSVSVNQLNFGTSTTSLTVNIKNNSVGTLNWSVTKNASWLTVSPASGETTTETDVLSVSVDRGVLSPANYTDIITITSNANSETIGVLMTVPNTTSPQISVFPTGLDYGTSEIEKSMFISNTGIGSFNWTITADQTWIIISPASGSTSDETDEVTVSIDRNALVQGENTGNLTISSDVGNVIVSVIAEIPEIPVLIIDTNELEFGETTTSLSFSISNGGGGILTWSASESEDWMGISPVSGNQSDIVNITVDRTGLTPGNYSGDIDVTSNGGDGTVTAFLTVAGAQPPDPVTLLEPTNLTVSSADLTWSRYEGSRYAAYQVYYDTSPAVTENSTLVETITDRLTNSTTVSSLTDDTEYFFRIYVMNEFALTSGSNVMSAKTLKQLGTWSVVWDVGDTDLENITIVNDNLGYAVGDDEIYIWDGSTWSLDHDFNQTDINIGDIDFASTDSIWIVVSGNSSFQGVYRWDGFIWSREYSAKDCFSIEALSSDNVFVGCDGAVVRWDGDNWIEYTLGESWENITDLYFVSLIEGWAISDRGDIYFWNGFGWSAWENSLSTSWTTAIYAPSPNNVWITGIKVESTVCTSYATVWHWNGTIWNPRRCSDWINVFPPEPAYFDVKGSSVSNIWMVRTKGKIRHWDGSEIQEISSPIGSTIYGINVQSITSAWAVGVDGIILRYVE